MPKFYFKNINLALKEIIVSKKPMKKSKKNFVNECLNLKKNFRYITAS